MEETGEHEVTPVQFAILNAVIDDPGEDQVVALPIKLTGRGVVAAMGGAAAVAIVRWLLPA